MIFKWICEFIENHSGSLYDLIHDYRDHGDLDDILYNSHILSCCKKHITPAIIKYVQNHNICLCYFKQDHATRSEDEKSIFVVNDEIYEALQEQGIHIEKITSLSINTRVNGINSSKKEKHCFDILKSKYNDLLHQYKIPYSRKAVDFYSPSLNLIIEFLGDYYHGNLAKFDRDDINPTVKKTYGELNDNTFLRFDVLKKLGYNIKYIWECDFNMLLRTTN